MPAAGPRPSPPAFYGASAADLCTNGRTTGSTSCEPVERRPLLSDYVQAGDGSPIGRGLGVVVHVALGRSATADERDRPLCREWGAIRSGEVWNQRASLIVMFDGDNEVRLRRNDWLRGRSHSNSRGAAHRSPCWPVSRRRGWRTASRAALTYLGRNVQPQDLLAIGPLGPGYTTAGHRPWRRAAMRFITSTLEGTTVVHSRPRAASLSRSAGAPLSLSRTASFVSRRLG